MFSKKQHGDVKKSSQKVLDPKKDSITRLKHLRVILEHSEAVESKAFFEQYYSHVYQVFYDNFISVEAALKQKVHKAQREELDGILFVFEKILVLLPDYIHERWQFHSIGRLMKKLLHPGNALKLRREGIRLFLLWFQALQEHADEECYLIYATLIPGFPHPQGASGIHTLDSLINNSARPPSSVFLDFTATAVTPVEITPLIAPQSGEKQPENVTKFLLEAVLHFTVTQITKMEWRDPERREKSFIFLFENFKKYYLPDIFPKFSTQTSLYDPVLDVPEFRSKSLDQTDSVRKDPIVACRVSVIRWVVAFTMNRGKPQQRTSVGDDSTLKRDDSRDVVDNNRIGDREENNPPSNSSTLTSQSDRDTSTSSISSMEESQLHTDAEIVRDAFYANRDNVNFVHEIFRQGFLLNFNDAAAMRKVVRVYQDWIQQEDKPVFMLDSYDLLPDALATSQDSLDSPCISEDSTELSGQLRSIGNQTEMESGASASNTLIPHIPGVPYKRFSQSDTYLGAINQAVREAMEQCNVRAGEQATLQVFITHSANVFLLEPVKDQAKLLDDQVDMCKRVLHIYRHMVMNVHMSKRTWEQLLMVLLRITEVILKNPPEKGNRKSLSRDLAAVMFQTLIVTWIKANLNVAISTDLWNELLRVLSSLTHWEELIKEWAKTMETLTRVLAKHVYNLDLGDLPLDKLSEQKQKRRRGRHGPMQKSQGRHERSFSKGWSRTDSLSPHAQEEFERLRQSMTGMASHHLGKRGEGEGFRQRSATTVGPGASHTVVDGATSSAALAARLRHRSTGEAPHLNLRVIEDGVGRRQFIRQQSLSCTEPEAYKYHTCSSDDDESKMSLVKSSSTGDLVADAMVLRLKGESFSSETSNITTSSGVTGSTAATDSLSIGDIVSMPGMPRSLAAVEDHELASLATLGDSVSFDSTNQGDHSQEHSNHGDDSGEHSNSSMFEIGRVSPPIDAIGRERDEEEKTSRSSSRSPSPATFMDMQHKDSPTQESLQLETVVAADEIDSGNHNHTYLDGTDTLQASAEMNCHVILGGSRQGWLPDVAVVLWKRMLGILGDINEIKDPTIHAEVFEYLWDLWVAFSKMRDNLGISVDNLSTPPPPRLVPPLRIFSPWLFKAVSLPKEYHRGRLLAYRLLCAMTVRRHEHELPMDHLVQFYRILHHGLVGTDQDIINTIVRHTSPLFFSCSLPGSTMLVLDYIQATNMIVSSTELDAPRVEAISLLGSLICFPNMYCNMQALQPNSSDISMMSSKDLKDHIISILLKAGRKEPHFEARCVALSLLGMFVYEEVIHGTYHSRLKEAINVLLATIKFSNKAVAQVASDMLLLLCYEAKKIRFNQPEMPKKIIEVIALTILNLLPSTEASHNEDDKKLLVSLMFCMFEWCMALPISVLNEPVENKSDKENKPLLATVFRVLQAAAQGVNSQHRQTPFNFSDIASNDYDPHVHIDNIRENLLYGSGPNTPRTPIQLEGVEDIDEEDSLLAPIISDFHRRSPDVMRLAAKTVMSHLLSHLGHFPLGCGPSRINTLVSEYHDNPSTEVDELSTELFSSPNVQFFVCNNSFLMSYVEIPAELDAPGGGVTAGLTTAKTQSRVVLRDLCGKFVWDSAILYGPPECAIYPYPDLMGRFNINNNANTSSDVFDDNTDQRTHENLVRQRSKLPSWEESEENQDVLDELLQYIGHTSNECLQKPGRPLNIAATPPEEITPQMEKSVKSSLLRQFESEEIYVHHHGMDCGMVSKPQQPWPHNDPASPFYICRLMLSQLGMMAWEKRANFDLLKKNDKLMRELKNLDSQLCRETHKIAVLYVAEGQEDKNSVLSNSGGSEAYENFLAGLAWEVDLSTHTGFMGGLQKNKSTGDTAPFYSTSAAEVIFHVATRMPTSPDDLTIKLRHLGNDEVHIVWSEHSRDYRRGIIATEFGDVLICIYPLPNQLYRIQIQRKPEVPYFGPLFDGAIVDHRVLPGLVRATAINASRVKRSAIPLYQKLFGCEEKRQHQLPRLPGRRTIARLIRSYEERSKYLEAVIKNHRDPTTFEEFTSHVFAPAHDRNPAILVAVKNYFGEVSSLHSASSTSTAGTVEHTGSISSIRSSASSQATVTSQGKVIKDDRSSGDFTGGEDGHATATRTSSKGKLTSKSRQPSSGSVKDGTPPDSPGIVMKGKRAS